MLDRSSNRSNRSIYLPFVPLKSIYPYTILTKREQMIARGHTSDRVPDFIRFTLNKLTELIHGIVSQHGISRQRVTQAQQRVFQTHCHLKLLYPSPLPALLPSHYIYIRISYSLFISVRELITRPPLSFAPVIAGLKIITELSSEVSASFRDKIENAKEISFSLGDSLFLPLPLLLLFFSFFITCSKMHL